MGNKHDLLYKTWTAGLTRRWRIREAKRREKKVCVCVYRQHRQWLWPLKWQNRPDVREVAPQQIIQQLSWLQPKSGHESQRDSLPRRTDWL